MIFFFFSFSKQMGMNSQYMAAPSQSSYPASANPNSYQIVTNQHSPFSNTFLNRSKYCFITTVYDKTRKKQWSLCIYGLKMMNRISDA